MLTIKVDKHCVKEIAASGGIMELSAELLLAVGGDLSHVPAAQSRCGGRLSADDRARDLGSGLSGVLRSWK